jgi:hypothetical protein
VKEFLTGLNVKFVTKISAHPLPLEENSGGANDEVVFVFRTAAELVKISPQFMESEGQLLFP